MAKNSRARGPFTRPDDLPPAAGVAAEAPGEFPYTRGIQPTMYRGRLWTMRQYAGFGTASESNARYRYLLAQGVSGLSVAFDLPTQMGYDSDHPMAAGEVGRVGVAIDSIEDMAVLFDGIPLDRVSTSMTINSTAIVLLSLYVAVARRQGIPLTKLSGTIQNDILKEYIARGTYIYPPRHSLRIVTDIFAWCERELPNWNTISISGYHIREAGSTAVQEVAFTLANAIAYVEAAGKSGLGIDTLGPRLSFFFNAHNDFIEEIAKFRAARRLWAHICRDRFGATTARAMQLRFHTQTAGSTLTAQQPDNNIVRVAIQAMAAVLGGTQSLHCNGRDEALALPTEEAARIALRTQQIIASESGAANTVDPLGGAWAIEEKTASIEAEARQLISKIDSLGGTLAAIESGWIQRQVQDAAYAAQQAIDRADQIIVGVNQYQTDEASHIQLLRIDPASETRQAEAVRALRASRDRAAWQQTIAALEQAAIDGGNLVPCVLAAVEARATLGEISDTMRRVFGEHRDQLSDPSAGSGQGPLLRVSGLRTTFPLKGAVREAAAVDDVSFEIARGETLGLVGESGSGKSVTALSIIRLVMPPGRITQGRIELEGRNLMDLGEEEMRQVRGRRIGFIFQEPMVALNPVYTIGFQIRETLAVHDLARGAAARKRTLELLDAVRVPDPERRAKEYPHQLSGGLRQRAMIALALAADPALVIADEPTTALDVTVQAEVLDLLRDLRRTFGLSLLLITHDLGVVAEMADRVAVMYCGRIVEQAPVSRIFSAPAHPYTRGLLASIPGGKSGDLLTAIPGVVPALGQAGPGCAFAPRCADRMKVCDAAPGVTTIADGHTVRCFLHDLRSDTPGSSSAASGMSS